MLLFFAIFAMTNLGGRQDGRGLVLLFFAIFAMTNLGSRQDGTGLLCLFFAIFAMASFRSRQDWKAGGSLLFMVASFLLCANWLGIESHVDFGHVEGPSHL